MNVNFKLLLKFQAAIENLLLKG